MVYLPCLEAEKTEQVIGSEILLNSCMRSSSLLILLLFSFSFFLGIDQIINFLPNLGILHEPNFAEMAGERKKVDEFPPIIPQIEDHHRGQESKFDLRKSFAWDSAFFTSPGLLTVQEIKTPLTITVK